MTLVTERVEWTKYIDSIINLFREVFGKSITKDFLNWRYSPPQTASVYWALEFDEKKICASYSICPVDLEFQNEIIKSAFSMTTMTSPKHTGRGLFPKLANLNYSKLSSENFILVWGFPNKNSHRLFIEKLDWKDIYEIPTLKLETANIIDRKSQGLFNVQRDDDFLKNYDSPKIVDYIQVKKTKSYLKWRYLSNPTNEYFNFIIENDGQVESFIIMKFFEDSIDFVDMMFKNESQCRYLLNFVLSSEIVKNSSTSISCWMPTHHFAYKILEELGFENGSPVTYFCFRPLNRKEMQDSYGNYRNWYIQMGDSDIF